MGSQPVAGLKKKRPKAAVSITLSAQDREFIEMFRRRFLAKISVADVVAMAIDYYRIHNGR